MTGLSTIQRSSPAPRRAAGFTLMELMVVVIVVGILASIALPAYQESMRKSRRTDAKEALMAVASREEQYMLDRSTYTANMTDLGYDLANDSDPMISDEGHYEVDRIDCDAVSNSCPSICDIATATCFVLQATPRDDSPQSEDLRCTGFSLASTGAQSATGNDAANCW
ncbi:MAG: type IV pilin protein [Halioglobus sp.]